MVQRVAALYDVHGNLPALEAALAAAESESADVMVFGGDMALGPMPREVLDRIRGLGARAVCLRGNCDRLMVDAFDGTLSPTLRAAVRDPIRWAADQLTREDRDLLAALPATIAMAIDGLGDTLFCHATPRSDERIFTVRTPDERARSLFGQLAQGVVVCGHTHMQFRRRVDSMEIVNAGSVGMPYGEAGAHWLLLGPGLVHRRTAYDPDAAVRVIEESTFPGVRTFIERAVVNPPSDAEMLAAFEPPVP